MKATITKNIGATKAQRYTAEYGCLSVNGASAANARADLDTNVQLALERLHKGAQIMQLGDLTGAWTLIGQQAFDAGLDDVTILANMPAYPGVQMRHWLRLQRELTV